MQSHAKYRVVMRWAGGPNLTNWKNKKVLPLLAVATIGPKCFYDEIIFLLFSICESMRRLLWRPTCDYGEFYFVMLHKRLLSELWAGSEWLSFIVVLVLCRIRVATERAGQRNAKSSDCNESDLIVWPSCVGYSALASLFKLFSTASFENIASHAKLMSKVYWLLYLKSAQIISRLKSFQQSPSSPTSYWPQVR